ncbi:MAG: hypothetical protein CFE45_07510 [Burkholderiales bacterium PBB5]|nr:MAG: hypothetical protein CFE45_07510 [Burkholderiales bacterium PBB5]
MLVDLVLMRSEGVKLPRTAILAAVPLRGVLRISTYRAGPRAAPGTPVAQTSVALERLDGVPGAPLACMGQAMVTRLTGDTLIIVGLEAHGHPTLGRLLPQAWWCRMVRTAPADVDPVSGPAELAIAGEVLPA